MKQDFFAPCSCTYQRSLTQLTKVYWLPSQKYMVLKDALSFMKSYLTKRQQRDPAKSKFSTWEKITSAVCESSILGQLLFNTFLMILPFC